MRKRRAVKRDVLADPIYNSKLVTKLINSLMIDGKKGKAQTILYDAFDIVKERTNEESKEEFIVPKKKTTAERIGFKE